MSYGRPRRRTAAREPMDDASAAQTIQAWFNGNVFRGKMEEDRVMNNVQNGMNGASQYTATSRRTRRSTIKMPKVCCNHFTHFVQFVT